MKYEILLFRESCCRLSHSMCPHKRAAELQISAEGAWQATITDGSLVMMKPCISALFTKPYWAFNVW